MKKILLTIVMFVCGMLLHAQSQLENPGFEEWEDVGLPEEEPVDWSSIKTSQSDILNANAPIVWWKSTDAHSGNYSLKLRNIYVSLIQSVATGTITNGRVNSDINPDLQFIYSDVSDSRWHSTFTTRPDSVTGWYKYYPLENDSAMIRVLLHRGEAQIPSEGIPENWVAMAFYMTDADTADEWTRFSVPFEYHSEDYPEYALVIINSGNGFHSKENSILYIDDIEMIHNVPVGLTEPESPDFHVYLDRGGNLHIQGASPSEFHTIRIMDLTGRTLWYTNSASEYVERTSLNLNRGIYLISLENVEKRYVQKIIIE